MFAKFRSRKQRHEPSKAPPTVPIPILVEPPSSAELQERRPSTSSTVKPSEITSVLPLRGSISNSPESNLSPGIESNSNATLQRSPSQSSAREGSRSPSKEIREDGMGLVEIYKPDTPPTADVIFVHGLGGTRRHTWTKDEDPNLFWLEWLRHEPVIQTARILSFGYNSSYKSPGKAPITGISDFARDLLFGMKHDEGIGKRPIVFVAHSMGGLVVKKAYILGQNDDNFKNVVAAIGSIIFLATPHRGSDFAEILKRILQASLIFRSRQYIEDLKRSSPILEDINDQFKDIAPKLKIYSFYETLPTPVLGGMMQIIVVEKSSAILGLKGEMSKSLNSHHRNACKYNSTEDSNYIAVTKALKNLVSKHQQAGIQVLNAEGREQMNVITPLLSASDKPDEDYTFYRDRWKEGTCDWILSNTAFEDWEQSSTSSILWLYALPASGKSILSSFVVDHLKQSSLICQYYFFRFDTQIKRSLSSSLRALALQIAEHVPAFRHALFKVVHSGIKIDKADAKTVWQKLFVSILFKMELPFPLFWVVDALDESDSPRLLIDLIQSVMSSQTPIKVLLVSRPNPEISSAFGRHEKKVSTISAENEQDIRYYIEQEIEEMHASPEERTKIKQKILSKAHKNFLWAHLVLKELRSCLTKEEIDSALVEMPEDMSGLYEKMERQIVSKPAHRDLARTILMWAAYSRRPLMLDEFMDALSNELRGILDMNYFLDQVCGQFVLIDKDARLVLVHETARSYLTKTSTSSLAIAPTEAHDTLFSQCILLLTDSNHRRSSFERRKSSRPEKSSFLQYAITSWAYHLNLGSGDSENSLAMLVNFLQGHSVLSWMYELALVDQLRWLAYSSKALNSFVRHKRRSDANVNPLLHKIRDLEFLESWSTDLIKILGKFGTNLKNDPTAIFRSIPPFCPLKTAMYLQFGKDQPLQSTPNIRGLTNYYWDDSLSRVSVGAGAQALKIITCAEYIGILTTDGRIVVYNAETFDEYSSFHHGEYVSTLCFNDSGEYLASYGFHTTKIWVLANKQLKMTIQNSDDSRALTMAFAIDEDKIFIGSNDQSVRVLDMHGPEQGWMNLEIFGENTRRGLNNNAPAFPSCIAFDREISYVALGYRGFPLAVRCIEPPGLVNLCYRSHARTGKSWTSVDRVTWHEQSGEVLGIYRDGAVFRWHPERNTHQEVYADATELACSPEGRLFATGDPHGKLKLFNFQHFTLIYQLSCDDLVSSIAFSPDSLRLYDLRGPFCNAWEPNALLRLSESDERESDTRSEIGSTVAASVSEALADPRDSITALAIQPRGGQYIIGDENGVVSLFDTPGKPHELCRSPNMMTVENLDWGEDGKYLAISELDGKIIVKSIERRFRRPNRVRWATTTVFDVRVDVELGGIQQLLLSPDSKFLLVASRATANIWSLESKNLVASHLSMDPFLSTRWMKHPTDQTLLLSFNLETIGVYQWNDLQEVASFYINIGTPRDPDPEDLERPPLPKLFSDASQMSNNSSNKVTRLTATPDSGYIIFQYLLNSRAHGRRSQTVIFCTSTIASSITAIPLPTKIEGLPIPTKIADQIEIPLGILPKQRLVYLDKNYCLRSWNLDMDNRIVNEAQRHFFLPKDWQNNDCLQLCALMADGTFLIPNNGEVAFITCGLDLEWQ